MAKQAFYFTMDEQELNERYAYLDKLRKEVGRTIFFGALLSIMVGIASYAYGSEPPVEVTPSKPRHHRTLTLEIGRTIRGVPVDDKTPMPKSLVKVESVFKELEEKTTVEKSSVVQPHYGDV